MRILLTTINAKYIHTNRAIRLLAALAEPHFDVSFHEFTIKESLASMTKFIIDMNPDVLGLSTYIWNGEQSAQLIIELKKLKPTLIVIAGGPEMGEAIPHYFAKAPIDYIVKGEAEDVFVPLLKCIDRKETASLPGVATPNNTDVERLEVKDLSVIPSIEHLYNEDDYAHRIIYLEASRGCPFHCSYCLASLSNQVRHFPFEYVKNDIETLVNHGVNTLKYLDRTMNADPKRFMELCEYVSSLDQSISVQFEVSADILPPKVMDYLTTVVKPNVVRLEIGVQSVHSDTLLAVQRPHQVAKTLDIIRRLIAGGRVVLHTDLIAGLPYETLPKFKQSFNSVFNTFSHELQLGFLKLLQGTLLREQAQIFDYQYASLPPYEITSTKWLTSYDIEQIKKVESALDILWNRKRAKTLITSLSHLDLLDNPFDWLLEFASMQDYNERMQLVDFYRLLSRFVMMRYPNQHQLIDDIKMDYVTIQSVKPVPFWDNHESQLADYRERWLVSGKSIEQWQHITKVPLSDGVIAITHHPHRKIDIIKLP